MEKRSVVKHREEGGILGSPLEILKAQQHRKGSDKPCTGGRGAGEAPFFVSQLFLGGLMPLFQPEVLTEMLPQMLVK